MTIEETRPSEPGGTERQGDARDEVDVFQAQTEQGGAEIVQPMEDLSVYRETHQQPVRTRPATEVPRAPTLTQEEQVQAASALRGALEASQVRYPEFAQDLLNNPEDLWLLGEVRMMLTPEESEVANDYAAQLGEGLTTTTGQRQEYEYETAHQETQQLFWNEIGEKFDPEDRDLFIDLLAQLSPRGANRVAAQALAWVDTHGLEGDTEIQRLVNQPDLIEQKGEIPVLGDISDLAVGLINTGRQIGAQIKGKKKSETVNAREQLMLNIANWAAAEQQYDVGEKGFFGAIDKPQEAIEQNVVSPLINAGVGLLSGAEEAARRKHLTPGQQIAFQFGAEPPKTSGEMGWWNLISGAADAHIEISADPLAWIPGLGLGAKGVKTIAWTGKAARATRAGRALAAARALLPKPFTGGAKAVQGGRFARVTYALGAKNMDELLAKTVQNGIAEDAMNLIKQGNMGKFQRLYKSWRGISDEAVRTIQESVQNPEEFIEVLKADALNEVLRYENDLDNLTRNAKKSKATLIDNAPTKPIDDVGQEVMENADDYVFHATTKRSADKITEQGFNQGTLVNSAEEAINHARSRGALKNDPSTVVVAIRKDDLISNIRKQIDDRGFATVGGDTAVPPMPGGNPMKGRYAARVDDAEALFVKGEQPKGSFTEMLANENIPRDIRLQAAKDQLRLNTYNMKSGNPLLIYDVPTKPKRIFSWQKALDTKGTGRIATGVRRTVARITPGRIPDEIRLFSDQGGADDLRRIGEHFGVRQDVLDDLVSEFQTLEMGARQDWIWDKFMRQIGKETGVPAFEQNLIQFYRGAGIKNFSASGIDLLDDGGRIPMLPSQVTDTMPVPVQVLTQVHRRAQSIGNRSKVAKALGFKGRGLGKTSGRRMKIVNNLRRQLGDQVEGMTDDQLYEMAFSLVDPSGVRDARGLFAGKMMPKAGTGFNKLHSWFTKSMLVFRPIQWMWRVALLEEPIRAHMFNMPSLYSNPLQYMASAREAHYIANAHKWAEANVSWGQDVLARTLRGSKDDIIGRLDEAGIKADIFPDGIPDSYTEVRRGVESFVNSALYGRTRPNKLNPIKRVPWAVKNRAHSISKAEKALKKFDLPNDFDFHVAARPIEQRLVSGYLGEAVGATDRKLYQYTTGLSEEEAFTHGRVWGANLTRFVEDEFGRAALRRRAAILRGDQPDVTGHDLVNSSRWEFMAPDLRMKYANEVDDVAIAERYMDEMLRDEINHLFSPFFTTSAPDEVADLLDTFASSRRLRGTVAGESVDIDLRGANHGGGLRDMGDLVASVRRDPNVDVPSNLPAPSFDPRFMAEDDASLPSRLANTILQTFGENATQTLNRRPAWIHTYKRNYDNYINLGIPADNAAKLATDHANKMVNHVFFNMDEAPYYVSRLNKILPFFGATYEVMGTWAYKMPAEIGGYWPAGIGEFTRKFDRIIDGLVNIGLLDREENEDGTTDITLNLVPPTVIDPETGERKLHPTASDNELGRMLQGAGWAAVNSVDQVVSTLLNLEEGLGLRSQGYRLSAGHPLNPSDYGILSFAQADVGLNPATNIAVSTLGALIPGATGARQDVSKEGETIADVAARLGVDPNELIRYNRSVFIDTEEFGSEELYEGLLNGNLDPEDIELPDRTIVRAPETAMWDAISDTFMPFGEISNPHEFAANFVPSTLRWAWAGLALQNQPSDEFWKDSDLEGVFGGLLPKVNEAQAASQLNEAFMYLEAHDLVNGKGPWTRIQEKEAKLAELPDDAFEERNQLRGEIDRDVQAYLDEVQKTAASSLFMRGLTGQVLPTTPGHVRESQEKIREFWDSRNYADSIKAGPGEARLKNFQSIEEIEDWKEQVAAWLNDPTGDRARATFRENNPQLMAYLTPKTFYKEDVPDIRSYEEYQRQIKEGEREPSPLHISLWRYRSSTIQADFYNKYISKFGNDPNEAAANALQNRQVWQELNDERDVEYQALEMWDDMHGSVYDNWRRENYGDVEEWAQDQINDKLNKVRDNLGILFELEDDLDVELGLDGIANLNSSIRGAIAEISNAIRDYNELTEDTNNRNPYEQAINRYFDEVYIPYSERISELYDQLPEVGDSEKQALIYEKIKFVKNEYADSDVYLNGDTTTPFPNPLEYSWRGKNDEEQQVKLQQWVTRPIEWMDLDQARRVVERSPAMAAYVPTTKGDFDIYRTFTLDKIRIDEAFEANEITTTQKRKAMDRLEENLKRDLITQGRKGEVEIMDMTPYEKLELAGMLPRGLAELRVGNGILSDAVRYYNQTLNEMDESAGTINGRKIVEPLYNVVEQAFHQDPNMKTTLRELGINLNDDDTMDNFLPWLFFGHSQER